MNTANITCPECNFSRNEIMPSNQCIVFYECVNCLVTLRPLKNDCCVFCSYSDNKCPSISDIVFNAAITTGIVCRPNCPPGRRTKPENRKYFKSLNDAYDEGFRDCLVCKPSEGPPGPWISKSKKTDYE